MTNSICLHCGCNITEDHQLIFDDTGKELDLQHLLMECFKINVAEELGMVQAMCLDCVNEMIEIMDCIEKRRELSQQQEEIINNNIDGNTSELEELDFVVDSIDWVDDEDLDTESIRMEFYDDADSEELLSILTGNDGAEDEKNSVSTDKDVEPIYLEEMEEIDIHSYKLNIFNNDFLDVSYAGSIMCRICSEDITPHSNILKHISEHQSYSNEHQFTCVVDEKCKPMDSLSDVSYHLISTHYDAQKLTVYTTCPDCGKIFVNLSLLNKHSCSQSRKSSRLELDCETCGKQFRSNKRYRFHQQFHLDKHRPKACLVCDKLFRFEDEFFEHVMYFHDSDETKKLLCLQCDRQFTSERTFKAHLRAHTTKRKFECRYCNKKYIYKQMLTEHINENHKNCSEACEICGKTFARKAYLAKHMILHKHPTKVPLHVCSFCGLVSSTVDAAQNHIDFDHPSIEDVQSTNEVILVAMACEYCDKAFNTVENLKTHRSKHKDKLYYCSICPMKYQEFKRLQTHKISHNKNDFEVFLATKHYVCDFENCNASYSHWPSLSSHKSAVHIKKTISTCLECKAIFNSKPELSKHVTSQHGGLSLDCKYCDMKFKTQMALAVHTGKKHNQTKFKCDECGTCYKSEARLNQHQSKMHIRMSCELCGKDVKNKKNLDLHMSVVHENVKRFFCSYCNKGYYNNNDCLEHEKAVHARQKRFQCDMCDYGTYYAGSLKVHKLQHDKSNAPFKCDICSKPFLRKATFDLHVKRHFLQREFVCPIDGCDKSYPGRSVLNRHIKIKHSECLNLAFASGRILKGRNGKIRLAEDDSNLFVDDDDGLEADDPTEVNVIEEEEIIEEIFYSDEEHSQILYVDHKYISQEDDVDGGIVAEYEVS